MERVKKSNIIRVDNPPGGSEPHTICVQRADHLRRGHPSFGSMGWNPIAAVVRNEAGFVIAATEVGQVLLNAEESGGVNRRIARIDACDVVGVPQEIVDN